MGWTVDPVEQALLFHYSEDPTIQRFAPHVPQTSPDMPPAVWAIDAARAPLYWFPRNCPRVAVWANTTQQRQRLKQLFDTDATRVQAAPADWAKRIETCELYEYCFDGRDFVPWAAAEGQWVAHRTIEPVSVEQVGDLLPRQREAMVDVRLLSDLNQIRAQVLASDLPFSIVRYAK